MKKILGLFLLFCTISPAGVKPSPLKVGIIISVNRSNHMTPSTWGTYLQKGIELALPKQPKIEPLVRKIFHSALEAKEAARELASEGADVITGVNLSDHAYLVKEVLEPLGIPLLAIQATAQGLFSEKGIIYTMGIGNRDQARALTNYLVNRYPKVAAEGVGLIVARNCSFCVDLESELKAALGKKGIPYLNYPDVLLNQPIPSAYFQQRSLKKVLALLTYEVEAIGILSSLAKIAFNGVLLGGDSWSVESIHMVALGTVPERVCLASVNSYDRKSGTAQNKEFIRRYKEVYGEEPIDAAALAFDAIAVIGEGAKHCGQKSREERRACIRRQFLETHIHGVTGPIAFTSAGLRKGNVQVITSSACK